MSFGSSSSSQNSQSSSSNRSYDFLRAAYAPQIGAGVGSSNALAALLGVRGGPAAQEGAFQKFLNSSGYKFQLGEGTNAITGNAASRGLLNSGSTLKKLNQYGQGIASNYLQQYMAGLSGLSQQGLDAGGLVSNAGQVSSSSSTGKSKSFNFGF